MLIGIDGNEANEVRGDIGEKVGANVYAFELLTEIYKLRKKNKINHNFVIYLKSKPHKSLPPSSSYWKYRILQGGSFWIIKRLMWNLMKDPRPDVFFAPNHYLPPVTLMPKVCTIHDLGYLNFSAQFKKTDFWQLKYWSAISISISKRIIAVSKATKKDIVRHYPSASKKIDVVYHGHRKEDVDYSDVRRVQKKYKTSNNYLLFLSTLKPSKNVDGILEAFSHLKKDNKWGYKLVISGKKGWMYKNLFAEAKELKLGNDVVFTGFVAENDKQALMKGAKVFLSPSHWEGFGLHVLESISQGTPVVSSSKGSLTEVLGDSGIYVEPKDSKSIFEGIVKVLNLNETEYNKLVEKGTKQAQKFSWEKSALKTIKVLEQIS